MPAPIHLSPLQFRALGHGMIDWIADYLEGVEARSVSPSVRPGDIAAMLPADPPARGEDWGAILADIDRVVMPGITHWQSPNFFGYFPANGSYPAILGDLLSAGLGVNGMMWATSPAATEIETRVMDWLGRMVGLPESFLSEPREGAKVAESGLRGGGVIQATASEATLVALVAARARIMRASGTRERLDEKESNLLMYASNQAHSSVVKAAKIAGIGEKTGTGEHRCVRQIDVDADFAMNPEQLATAIDTARDQGHIPFFVVATVGTTGSTAIDRLDKLGPICRERNLWLHVDAAMAGAACICPEHRWMLHGIEHADSFSFNPHKWMLTNFDCAAMWTRDRASVIDALAIAPEYLRNPASESGAAIDYRDWQIPLGRRMRALKLWFVLRHYGVEGLQAYIREHMRIAGLFEEWVRADERFEVAAPRSITLICFRLRPRPGEIAEQTDARNKALLGAINATGRAFLSHTVLPIGGGDSPQRFVLRMAIGGARTQERHVRAAWSLISGLAHNA